MARNGSILFIRSEDTDVAVCSSILLDIICAQCPSSVLMQWAEGGSLDDFIDVRLGKASYTHIQHIHPTSSRKRSHGESQEDLNAAQTSTPYSRSARIRAFRAMQRAAPEERERLQRELAEQGLMMGRSVSSDMKAIHLLSATEVKSLFQDVVEGLAFLVSPYALRRTPLNYYICSTINLSYISISSLATSY